MLPLRLTLILLLVSVMAFGQPYPATIVYPTLSPYFFSNGYPNDLGFQFRVSRRNMWFDTITNPGLLVQLDHEGQLLHIDTLRNYDYIHSYKIGDLLLLSAYHFNKYPDVLSTWVFEVCDLSGNVLYTDDYDLVSCMPGDIGAVQFNDSVYIVAQHMDCLDTIYKSVYYRININSLEVVKEVKPGAISGNILKIDDQPRYLQWTYEIWIKDSTFIVNGDKVSTNFITPAHRGTMLPREDKPGWFGFGGCSTPFSLEELCLLAFDDQLKLDKIDIIYHPPSGNNSYRPPYYKSMCKQGDAYYVAARWNEVQNDDLPTELVIAKYDLQLNRVWTKIVGGDRRYRPAEIHPTKQGGFMIAGEVVDFFDNNKKGPFTMFFNEEGDVVGTEEPTTGQYDFTIYGNPGRESLRIMSHFDGKNVLLQVVNALGQPMLQYRMTEGMNEYDTSHWPSGTYLMSITDHLGNVLWSQPWIRE